MNISMQLKSDLELLNGLFKKIVNFYQQETQEAPNIVNVLILLDYIICNIELTEDETEENLSKLYSTIRCLNNLYRELGLLHGLEDLTDKDRKAYDNQVLAKLIELKDISRLQKVLDHRRQLHQQLNPSITSDIDAFRNES